MTADTGLPGAARHGVRARRRRQRRGLGASSADDDQPMMVVGIMESRDGKVVRERIYLGKSWEPPAWRAQWGELYDPLAPDSSPGPTPRAARSSGPHRDLA